MAAKVSNLNFEERKRREKVRIVYEVRFDEIFKIEDHYTYYDGKDNFVREQRNTSGAEMQRYATLFNRSARKFHRSRYPRNETFKGFHGSNGIKPTFRSN